jgi:hypothetical protein
VYLGRVHFREKLILVNEMLLIDKLFRCQGSSLRGSDVGVSEEKLISAIILIVNVEWLIEC